MGCVHRRIAGRRDADNRRGWLLERANRGSREDKDTGTSGHAGRRPQLAQSPGSSVRRHLPRARRGYIRPGADTTTLPSGAATVAIGRPVELSGADLYRLNCQSCHRAEGTGSLPEIKSVLGLVQGSSLELVRQQLQKEGASTAGSAVRAQATRTRADLYRRIQKGGQRMPAFAHLQEADINAIYAYLTLLAGAPDVPPQSRQTTSFARLGEHVVKGTCHICHDAVGPRPSREELLQGTIPPFTTLLEDKPVVDFVTKVRSGAPVVMGDPAFHYRGRMPVFPFLQDVEVAAAYVFMVDYPPRAGDSWRQ